MYSNNSRFIITMSTYQQSDDTDHILPIAEPVDYDDTLQRNRRRYNSLGSKWLVGGSVTAVLCVLILLLVWLGLTVPNHLKHIKQALNPSSNQSEGVQHNVLPGM